MMRALFPAACRKWCIVALLLSGIPSSVPGQTIATTVDCTSGRLGVAEREICASPELKQLNEEIDVHGVIHESCTNPAGPAVAVVFRSMTASAAVSFYDAKQPTTYWKGTVERRDA